MNTESSPQAIRLVAEPGKASKEASPHRTGNMDRPMGGKWWKSNLLSPTPKKKASQYIEKGIESTTDLEIPSSNPILIFTYELISPTCHSAVLSHRFSVWAILLQFVNLVSVRWDQNSIQGGKKRESHFNAFAIASGRYLNHIFFFNTHQHFQGILGYSTAQCKVIMKSQPWHPITLLAS